MLLLQSSDFSTDFERGAELHVHGGHEVVLLEQHERLPVDLLGTELVGVRRAPRQRVDELVHIRHLQHEGNRRLTYQCFVKENCTSCASD